MKFEQFQNAFLSAVPYLCMWICAILSSHIADYIRTKGIWSTTKTRKIMNLIGKKVMYIFQNSIKFWYKKKTFSAFIPPAICLCMLHFVGCHRYLVVVLLCATLGINGFNFSAVTCNQLDIAPKFAGTLMGITNSVGNIMGFLAPQISGAILNGHVSL